MRYLLTEALGLDNSRSAEELVASLEKALGLKSLWKAVPAMLEQMGRYDRLNSAQRSQLAGLNPKKLPKDLLQLGPLDFQQRLKQLKVEAATGSIFYLFLQLKLLQMLPDQQAPAGAVATKAAKKKWDGAEQVEALTSNWREALEQRRYGLAKRLELMVNPQDRATRPTGPNTAHGAYAPPPGARTRATTGDYGFRPPDRAEPSPMPDRITPPATGAQPQFGAPPATGNGPFSPTPVESPRPSQLNQLPELTPRQDEAEAGRPGRPHSPPEVPAPEAISRELPELDKPALPRAMAMEQPAPPKEAETPKPEKVPPTPQPKAKPKPKVYPGEKYKVFIGGKGAPMVQFKQVGKGQAVIETEGQEPLLEEWLNKKDPAVIYLIEKNGTETIPIQGCRIIERTTSYRIKFRTGL